MTYLVLHSTAYSSKVARSFIQWVTLETKTKIEYPPPPMKDYRSTWSTIILFVQNCGVVPDLRERLKAPRKITQNRYDTVARPVVHLLHISYWLLYHIGFEQASQDVTSRFDLAYVRFTVLSLTLLNRLLDCNNISIHTVPGTVSYMWVVRDNLPALPHPSIAISQANREILCPS